jgi:ring-1,2-phenylacetyl-CoA epoxidase subunit PaaC
LFAEDDVDRAMTDRGIAPGLAEVQKGWKSRIDLLLAEATLEHPRDRPYSWFGKHGHHSEHLGYMLADMQYLQRTYPGARW